MLIKLHAERTQKKSVAADRIRTCASRFTATQWGVIVETGPFSQMSGIEPDDVLDTVHAFRPSLTTRTPQLYESSC